eukprot:m.78462 g.78462  ORF g.78462 m.78462 type:complete len:317 (+) comp8161_c0_seq1:723-1673(+)
MPISVMTRLTNSGGVTSCTIGGQHSWLGWRVHLFPLLPLCTQVEQLELFNALPILEKLWHSRAMSKLEVIRVAELVEHKRVGLDAVTELVRLAADHDRDVVRLGHHGNHGCANTAHNIAIGKERVCGQKDFGHAAHNVRDGVDHHVGTANLVLDELFKNFLALQLGSRIDNDDAKLLASGIGIEQNLKDELRGRVDENDVAILNFGASRLGNGHLGDMDAVVDKRVDALDELLPCILDWHVGRQAVRDFVLDVLDGVAHARGKRAALLEEANERLDVVVEVAGNLLVGGQRVILEDGLEGGKHGQATVGAARNAAG